MTPPALDRVVKVCMAKDPDERWQSAHDLTNELRWIAEGGSQAGIPAPVVARRKSRERLAWALAGLGLMLAAIATGIALWTLTKLPSAAPRPLVRFNLQLQPAAFLQMASTVNSSALALSPDGTHLVYVAFGAGGARQLYMRPMDRLETILIPGSEEAFSPFFSPDGQWIGFFAGGRLKKVALTGGSPVALCDTLQGVGASWASDDTILFTPSGPGGILRVPAAGGTPEVVTTPDAKKGEFGHWWPEILPGNKAILFTIANSTLAFNENVIVVQSLKTGERRILGKGTSARYLPTGHIVFASGGSLLALPFDLNRLQATGPPVAVLDGVMMLQNFGNAHFAISKNGSLVYAPGGLWAPQQTLVWVDRDGTARPLPARPNAFETPRFSPDGRRLAVTLRSGNTDVYVYDLARGTLTRLTFDPGEDETPVWIPDGKRVAFSSSPSGPSPNGLLETCRR